MVKIEIWPLGEEKRARELQRLTITNIGGSDRLGNYQAVLTGNGKGAQGTMFSRWPRERTPAQLVWRALVALMQDIRDDS